MTTQKQKKIFLSAAAVFFCAGLLFTALVLKDYSHTVPVVVGAYKKAVLILLFFFAGVSVVFSFCPLNGRTAAGVICVFLSVAWFTCRMILGHRSPDSRLLLFLDQWMTLPLAFFGGGAALLTGALFPGSIKRPVISEKWVLFLLLLLVFIVLQPGLRSGYNWDDAFISVEAQFMRISGEPIFKRVWREIVEYARIGRINPFATFHYLVFYFLPDVRIYKLLLAALTLLNAFLFYCFLKLWNKESRRAALITAIVPLCFQFRLFHDPMNSYYGLMQVMFCELMAALIFNLRWLKEKKPADLVWSLLFFVMGLMSYEMFFPLTALFFVTAFSSEKKFGAAVRKTLVYILIAVLIFGLSMALRTNITEETAYNGTTFGLDVPLIFRTFINQVTAAFPLSYRSSGYDAGLLGQTILWKDIFNTSLSGFLKSIQWQDVLACCVLVIVMKLFPEEKEKFSLPVLFFGLLLWLLPGVVISLSTKYQEMLHPGLAYIPVYFSYFGAAILLFEGFVLLNRFFPPKTLRLFCTGIACAVLLVLMQDNRGITEMLNGIFYYPRSVGEAALQAGILDETGERMVLSDAPYYLWEHGWMWEPYQTKFYSLNARRPLNAMGIMDFADEHREEDPSWIMPADTTLISYFGDKEGGFVKSGRLRGTGFDPETNTLVNTFVTDIYYFVSGKNQNGVLLSYKTKDGEWKTLDIKNYGWLINKTDAGELYKLEEKNSVLFDTVRLITY